MGADQRAGIRDLAQHRVEPVAAASRFDGVAPDEHDLHPPQLPGHLVGEVIVIDGRLGVLAGRRERYEQPCEAALRRIGAVPCGCACSPV